MKKTIAVLAAGLALASACKEPLSAPNEDAPLAGGAIPVQNLATGVLGQDRAAASTFAYLLYPEGFARNALRPDPNEPRFISDIIGTTADPSAFLGGSGWAPFYTGIRAANQVLTSPSVAALSAGDRNATLGLIQTIKALQYVRLVQLRDSNGVVIQSEAVNTPDPIRTKAAVLAYTSSLLDSAYANLTAANVSSSVPFTLPSGYTSNGDFSLVSNLRQFNRGLKGEVEVYRLLDHQSPCAACAATAISALNIALDGVPQTSAGLAFGPYYEYNPSAPESFKSPLSDNRIYVTDNWVNSIQPGDARAAKASQAATSSVQGGLVSPLQYKSSLTDPNNQTRLVPIRRAALWFLLRAQAEAESAQLAAARADVNVVHTVEGNLSPVAFATVADARAAILYEYRYSFLFEGPFHLVALREYGALTKAYVTQPGMPSIKTDPTHDRDPLQSAFPIPQNEVTARNGDITPKP